MESMVAIVFSNWTLSKIYDFFKDYLEARMKEIGVAKIERYKDKKSGEMRDSNRTLFLIKRSLYEKAIQQGLNSDHTGIDFRIDEFRLKDKNYPFKDQTFDLFIIIPKDISCMQIEYAILEKMKSFVAFGFLTNQDYSLKIPLESRVSGLHRGFAYLSFSSQVHSDVAVYIKTFLHDSFIHVESKFFHLQAFWVKNNKEEKVVKILKRDESL